MVSLGKNNNNPGIGAGYFFTDPEEIRPAATNTNITLTSRPRNELSRIFNHSENSDLLNIMSSQNPEPFKPIYTGYLTILEAAIVSVYALACYIDILGKFDYENKLPFQKVSLYAILHVFIWALVGIFDRIIQWRHQKLRRRGYLKKYLRFHNIRRVPYATFSTGNAAIIIMFAGIYKLLSESKSVFKFDYLLLIIIGIEMLITIPVCIYYTTLTILFNLRRHKPDAVYTGTSSHLFASPPPDLGFARNSEQDNIEELLDKQADMIRYLQFHNANLGRKVMELQKPTD